MPITKKTTTTKKVYKRKGYRKSIESIVKSVLDKNSETKSHVRFATEQSMSTLSSPNTVFTLNQITKGDSKNNRQGDMIMPQRIDIRGQIQATNQEAVWYKVFLLEHNSGRNPLDDLLENNSGNFDPALSDLTAIYARINTGKYRVLGTRVIKTGTQSSTANDRMAVHMFHMNLPLRGKMYFDQGSDIPNKRKISLMVLGRRANNDDTFGLPFEFTFNSKLYFKDI